MELIKKDRIKWIDLLRVIGVICVIMIHVVSNTINTFGGLSNNGHIFYVFIHYFSSFAVPLFVMISGMMFLSKKELTYKELFKKYLLKIILIILVIGTGMILMEEIFINKDISINLVKKVFLRLITGDIWAHMWYLYLVLGLYLITPICILVTKNIQENEFRIFLIILFAVSIMVPTINTFFKINMAFNMLNISGYIFYYFYGYYLYHYDIDKKYKIGNYLLWLLAIIYTIYRAININSLDNVYSYTSLIPCVMASAIVVLFKNKEIKKDKLINLIAINSLGIYIIHQLFINIIYKVLKMDIIVSYPYIGLAIYSLVILICSLLVTYLLRKSSFIRKYFL
jgi:surface polysaccharide O-acyltransferase-like enzyme